MTCANCDSALPVGLKFCPYCGAPDATVKGAGVERVRASGLGIVVGIVAYIAILLLGASFGGGAFGQTALAAKIIWLCAIALSISGAIWLLASTRGRSTPAGMRSFLVSMFFVFAGGLGICTAMSLGQ